MIHEGDGGKIIVHKTTLDGFIERLEDAIDSIERGYEEHGLTQVKYVKGCLNNLANSPDRWTLAGELKHRMEKS